MCKEGGWSCPCGRACAPERTKCPACGAARGEAQPASGRLIAPSDAVTRAAPSDRPEPAARPIGYQSGAPVDPAPPGTPPVVFLSRTLLLDLPRVCCCCLGPSSGLPHQVVLGERGGVGIDIADTALGMLALAVTGFGWFTIEHQKGSETCLRAPVCAACRAHVTGFERAWIGAGVLAVATVVGALVMTPPKELADWITPLGYGLGVLFVGGLVLGLILGRPGQRCAASRPVGVAKRGAEFRIAFANPAYGRRALEANQRVARPA